MYVHILANQSQWHCGECRPVQDTDASTWEFSEDLIPNIKAQADRSVRFDVAVDPGEEGPIPPMHEGGLASYLGLTHAEIIQNATIVPSLARACQRHHCALLSIHCCYFKDISYLLFKVFAVALL